MMEMEGYLQFFVCNFIDSTEEFDENELVSALWACNWELLINTEFVVDWYRSNLKEIPNVKEQQLLSTAIAFLLAFVQQNFTGPDLTDNYKEFLTANWPKNINARFELLVDSEELNGNVHYPEYLLAARLLFKEILKNNSTHWLLQWWRLRLLCVHQYVLEETANTLYEEFKTIASNLSHIENLEFQTLLSVELCHGFLLFHRTQKAENIFNQLCENIEINLKVEGSLGFRTRFQQNALPQLYLKVEHNLRDKLPLASIYNAKTNLPKLLNLDDEVRLEKIRFVSEEEAFSNIASIVQTIILTKIKILKTQPKNKLREEELQPYITTLLYQDFGPLSVRLITLLLNIRLEATHKRTVERSLKQCEDILTHINDNKFPISQRFSYIFASSLTPRWEIQEQLADLMFSLGLTKSALDVYHKINCWEDIIKCYTKLELRHKATDIIKQQIDKEPSVKLYCLLGDATDNVSYYETAWTLSGETSSRAQRHWGNFYFARKEYFEAITHLKQSVQINSLQEVTWLRLGYAAMMTENWDLAVQAYLRYTHLEPNGFESWNNLAKALIKLGDKNRAHKILKEALKCNFNNWKVWENFMLVSVDTGHFEDVLNSYDTLIGLKNGFIDLEILTIVINAIVANALGGDGRQSGRLIKKANILLGQQCIQYGNEPKLWELSALLAESPLIRAQKLQKMFTTSIQKNKSWNNNKDFSLKMVELCKSICEYSMEAFLNQKGIVKQLEISQLSSARLTSQGCIKSIESHFEKWVEIEKNILQLKDYIYKITEILTINR